MVGAARDPKFTKRRTSYKNAGGETPQLVQPKSEKQKELIEALTNNSQVIVLGPAGTGKTFVPASFASFLYQTKQIDKIIVTRPNVAAGKSIGFFPGTLEEKMMPWIMPVLEVLHWNLGKGVVETGIKNGNIEIAPFETMRGRSFKDAFVICDEAQNLTPHEMKMFNTRIGENVNVVINGDVMQSDLPGTSGLSHAINLVKRYGIPVPIIEFTFDDIVRSDLCRAWITAYYADETKTNAAY